MTDEQDAFLVVESALFSAGRPMSIQEIVDATRLARDAVVKGLAELKAELSARMTAIEVVRAGEKYALQLKAEFAERARLIVPPEVPKHVLKTLALVAYHQPIRQSKILRMVGPRVYDHVQILETMGLVRKKQDGSTFELSTTEQFPEYFGVAGLKPEEIRAFLLSKMGLLPRKEAEASPGASPAAVEGPGPGTGPATDADDTAAPPADDAALALPPVG